MNRIILRDDEQGKRVECEIVCVKEHAGKQFMVVAEIDGESTVEDTSEVFVLQIEEVDGEVKLIQASNEDAESIFAWLKELEADYLKKPESIEKIE